MSNKSSTSKPVTFEIRTEENAYIVTKMRINDDFQIEAINEITGLEITISLGDLVREGYPFEQLMGLKQGTWIHGSEILKKYFTSRKRKQKSPVIPRKRVYL